MPRTAIGTLALLLIGMSVAAPALGRSLHRHTSFHFHHGNHPSETTPPIASTNRPNEVHAIDGHRADDRREEKTEDTRHGTDGNTPPGKQAISSERGPKQDAVDGGHQSGKGKEDFGGTQQGELPSGLRSGSLGPIDTRITVLDRGTADGRRPHLASKSKYRLVIPGATRAFYSRIPRAEHHSVRNAIGARIRGVNGAGRQGGDAASSPPVTLRAALAPPDAPRATGLITADRRDNGSRLMRPGASPNSPPPVIGRAAINGTGMAHSGFKPAFVGGPPRRIAGISGSMFRSKR